MPNTARFRGSPPVLRTVTVAGVLCAMAAVGWFAQRSAVRLDATDVGVEAAIVQITRESEARRPAPQAAAPPGFGLRGEPPENPESADPPPPPGYSIAAFHGEMASVPMAPQADPTGRDVAAEHPWLGAPGALDALVSQSAAADRDWTFGWMGLAPGAGGAVLNERLQALGARVLGRYGGLLRARLPGAAGRLERILSLPGVVGVAATPLALKMPPSLAAEALSRSPWARVPVWVTLMEGDPDGRWRSALTELGAVVGAFDPAIRVYPAVLAYAVLHRVAAADFVLAIEPVRVVEPANDSAVPAMGADALRIYDGGVFSGIGGATVAVGVMDTGLNVRHEAIGAGRRSICGANFAAVNNYTSPRAEDQDLWFDLGQHGTHVTGTLAGNGAGAPQFAGMAPLVRDIRFAKVLTAQGGGTSTSTFRGMDFLARPSACGGAGAPIAKAAVVNMSLSMDGFEWTGQSADVRKLDSIVWTHRQLYVVAQSNAGFEQYGNFASAKNALAVGAVDDGGDLASFSSIGPTADGRLKPQVVGTGVDVYSALGGGRRSGYRAFSGTSMAAPSVAGVAALLMDAVPALHAQPAAVRARLMASAIRPDAFLDDAGRFPLHNGDGPGELQHRYGLGKVSARTAVLDRDTPDGWASGSATLEIEDGQYGYRDIRVPAGASRLDVVLTWDERPADTLTGTVLNDLDLWVDRHADCPVSRPACGDGVSRSVRDNVEWVILRNPPAGVYRLKAVPKHVRVDTPRAALAWTVLRGPSTPQLSVGVDARSVRAAPGKPFTVTAALAVDGYVAAGAVLRVDCRGATDTPACERVRFVAARASGASREDGVTRTLEGESGDGIALGELAAGERQTVELVFNGVAAADRFRLYLTAMAWNAASASISVEVIVGRSNVAAAPVARAPANDHFAKAEPLRGIAGSREFDLLLATPEPGEAPFAQTLVDEFGGFQSTERPRSVWYRFTAPETDAYRFTVAKAAHDDIADDIQLDLFETCARRGRLRPCGARGMPLVHAGAKSGGGLTFAARRNQAYALRLGIVRERLFDYRIEPAGPGFAPEEGTPVPVKRRSLRALSLRWQPARRPPNDDFDLAEALTGVSGRARRNNQSATQQPGERLQPLAATAWYRWIAPPGSGGDWRFSVDRRYLHVAAFQGKSLQALRLVSGLPARTAAFPAAAGNEYRIVVASTDASVSGSDYALSWESDARSGAPENDDIERAEAIPGDASSSHRATLDLTDATVQPGEPLQSGARTMWWSWSAPADGAYAWRIDSYDGHAVRMAAFAAGEPPAPIAASEPDRTHLALSIDAAADQRYLFSVGVPVDEALLDVFGGEIQFEWGPTPSNDRFAAAQALAGAEGSVTGDSRFATVQPGEDTALLGDASLWWTWEAPATDWYRFELDGRAGGIVAVYRVRRRGSPEDTPVALSRSLERPTLVFRAKAGARYAVRVGTEGWERPGEFTLSWSESGPPSWLRYAGALGHGYADPGGHLTQLVTPGSIAFDADGGDLYVATALGLQAYERDPDTGELKHLQTLSGADPEGRLFWDAPTASLIGASCTGWRRYARSHTGLAPGAPIGGATPCPEGALLRGADGSVLHLAGPSRVVSLRLDEARSMLAETGQVVLEGLSAAAIHPAGEYVYAETPGALHVLEWNDAAGMLRLVATVDVAGGGVPPSPGFGPAPNNTGLLAVDPTGRYLLGVAASRDMSAFDLDNPAMPQPLIQGHLISQFQFLGATCVFAHMRSESLALDVFCEDSAYSVGLLPDIPALRTEDKLLAGAVDAFGNNVPLFPLARGAAASPDGRHVYATQQDAILIFERAGSR